MASEATALSELRWLASEVGADLADAGSGRAVVSLLGLIQPHLQGHEKLVADAVKDLDAADLQRQVLQQLAQPGAMSRNPLDALVTLDSDARTQFKLLSRLPSFADSANVAALQRALVKGLFAGSNNSLRLTSEAAASQFFDELRAASNFRGDLREGLMSVLDKTVNKRLFAWGARENSDRQIERVAWSALAEQVSPAERRLIHGAMRYRGVDADTVRLELMKAIKERRFERATEPEALLAMIREMPEVEGKVALSQGVLEQLQAYYQEVNEPRLLALVNMLRPEFQPSDSVVADSIFKRLEQLS